MRTPAIIADAINVILNDDCRNINGRCFIDEDYLKDNGYLDFKKYRCDPNHEPPRMMPKLFPSLLVQEEN
jgi:hypothetical protein